LLPTTEAGTRQVTPTKLPHGTRAAPFSAAVSLPWHGSRTRVAWDLVINIPYRVQPPMGDTEKSVRLCYSGLQIQGTANSPPITALLV